LTQGCNWELSSRDFQTRDFIKGTEGNNPAPDGIMNKPENELYLQLKINKIACS
jgi:hypothetical protein